MIPVYQYLVRYGRPGFIGRFASEIALGRGDHVVIQGPRGNEFGEVLVAPKDSGDEDGVILRVATADDDKDKQRLEIRGQELLEAASARSPDLPLSFVDVEVLTDGTAILHALAWDACDATPFLDQLAEQFGLSVRLLDLSRVPVTREPSGCGKPGCGTDGGGCSNCGTGGGCSTGSCSRGAVKSSDELTSYFADLRHKMEDAGLVRTPLN